MNDFSGLAQVTDRSAALAAGFYFWAGRRPAGRGVEKLRLGRCNNFLCGKYKLTRVVGWILFPEVVVCSEFLAGG
ncbi:MAG: hypothetical protein ACOC5A_03895 [Halanaerobiales bacterium]